MESVVFSIDNTPFEEFLFPRPVRTASEEMALDASSDEEESGDETIHDEVESVMSRYSRRLPAPGQMEEEESAAYQYILDVEVINPIVQKNENFVTYTV